MPRLACDGCDNPEQRDLLWRQRAKEAGFMCRQCWRAYAKRMAQILGTRHTATSLSSPKGS